MKKFILLLWSILTLLQNIKACMSSITSSEIYNNYSLDLTGYSKGIYIVKINTNDKQVVKKIILE